MVACGVILHLFQELGPDVVLLHSPIATYAGCSAFAVLLHEVHL